MALRKCRTCPSDVLDIDACVNSNAALARPDFSIEKEGYISETSQPWMAVPDASTSEWARYD